jgi:hypothetical protein
VRRAHSSTLGSRRFKTLHHKRPFPGRLSWPSTAGSDHIRFCRCARVGDHAEGRLDASSDEKIASFVFSGTDAQELGAVPLVCLPHVRPNAVGLSIRLVGCPISGTRKCPRVSPRLLGRRDIRRRGSCLISRIRWRRCSAARSWRDACRHYRPGDSVVFGDTGPSGLRRFVRPARICYDQPRCFRTAVMPRCSSSCSALVSRTRSRYAAMKLSWTSWLVGRQSW